MAMIFAETWELVVYGEKTQTRRVWHPRDECVVDRYGDIVSVYRTYGDGKRRERWSVDKKYSVQPGRGQPAVARIEIIEIRVEWLQDISASDLFEEMGSCDRDTGRATFAALWNRLHAHPPSWWREFGAECPFPGVRWEDNPLVVVLKFEKAERLGRA